MKQYVIDQLRESDYDRIQEFLNENGEKTIFEELYWITLPERVYGPMQREHTDCHPYYFAVNLSPKQVAFEWLIRSRQTLRCGCIGYATPEQRDYIIQFADEMLERLGIRL